MTFKEFFNFKNIIFVIVAILFLKFTVKISGIMMLFFAAYVLACSLNPLVEILAKKMSRSLAASVVITSMVAIFGAFFMPVIVIAIKQINTILQALPAHIHNAKLFIMNRSILGQKIVDMIDIPSFIQPVSDFTTHFVNQSITLTMSFTSAIIYTLAMCIIMYYFIVDKTEIREAFLRLFPNQMKENADRIIETISQKIGGYIMAQGVTILSVGFVFTVCLLILRVDYAILLGLITTVLDLVPVIGPAIALVICLLMCAHLQPWLIGLIVLSFFFAQWVENNFVRPYVFGKFLDIHPLLVFFSLFVTAKFLGVIGVIFAPALAATFCVILNELYIKPINDEKLNG